MATRMQQRRGTAAQWISTNAGAGPVLNAGEIGWESDTNKFKIGDGVNNWSSLDYFADINSTINPSFGSSITFEGDTADSYETILQVTDPTADRTITFPNATGTVVLADGSGNVTVSGDLTVSGTTTTINSTTINATTGIVFEGATADAFETTLTVTDPTADRTITFQNATGTVVLRDSTDTLTNKSISLGSNTVTSTLAQLNTAVSDADVASLAGTETLTNKTINIASNTLTGVAPLASPTFTGTVTLPSGTVTSTMIADGTILNEDINASAAIALSKLATDPLARANHTGSQAASTISDFNEAAQDAIGTILGTGLSYNDAGPGIGIDNAGLSNYLLDGVSGSSYGLIGTSVYLDIKNTNGYNKEIELDIAAVETKLETDGFAKLAGPTFTGTVSAANLTLSGDLTVNGTTTTINSTTLAVDDKNIVLGDVATPSDVTADGGGITLKGTTDKTFNWVDSTDSWTSSEHINLASGKSYYMNGTLLKNVSETLTNKTLSSATLTGTLTAGGGAGTAGQILKSTGSGVEWGAAASGGAAFSEFMLIGA